MLRCEAKIWTSPTHPALIATVFGILGLFAILGIQQNISSGTATGRGWTCTIDDNPIGFCPIIIMKAAVVGFAAAEILYAFELVGDPVAYVKHALPFLP